jgi:hypothetical protein
LFLGGGLKEDGQFPEFRKQVIATAKVSWIGLMGK